MTRTRRFALTVTICLLWPAVASAAVVHRARAARPDAAATTASSSATLSPSTGQGNWQSAIAAAQITKTDVNDPYYQYPLIGNGGMSLMPGPSGFTDATPSGASYGPVLSSDTWWNGNTASVRPFSLQGGYVTPSGTQDGTIGSFKQVLTPRDGHLTTNLTLTASGTSGEQSFQSTRTEFVTPSGVLVIHIADSVAHRFVVTLGATQGASRSGSASAVEASVPGGGPSGTLVAALSATGSSVQTDPANGSVSAQVDPGDPATFYIAGSGVDSNDPSTTAASAAGAAATAGYGQASDATDTYWTTFWQGSSVSVPDTALMTWYIRGQYYLASLMNNAQAPPGVSGPTGEYNGDADLEYDAVFDTLSLLTANAPGTASVTGNWVEKSLPAAEALAPYYTYNGAPTPGAAKYPWLGDYLGREDSQFGPSPLVNDWEAYPSADAAMVDILLAQYTNDQARLQRAKKILDEVTQYQLDNSARDPNYNNDWVSQRFEGLVFGAGNYVTGAVADQASLMWSLREASELGVGPAEWGTYANQVYLPTALDPSRNENVVSAFIGESPNISNQPYISGLPWYYYHDLSASSPLANPTLANMVGSPALGDTLMIGNAAVVADTLGQGGEALRLLHDMVDATPSANPSIADLWDGTYFSEGGDCYLPNADCAPGPSTTPNLSGHSSLNLALQHMLFDGQSTTSVTAFPALPPAWQTRGSSFSHLLASGDIEVSGSYSGDQSSVSLTNEGQASATRTVRVLVPADAEKIAQSGDVTDIASVQGRFASVSVTVPAGATRTLTLATVQHAAWQTVDDADSRITYAGGWSSAATEQGFYDQTAHYTANNGATASFTFTGTAVRIIGDCNYDHGQFSVTIDGQMQGWYDSWCNQQTVNLDLFEADDLSPGTHTIQLVASNLKDAEAAASNVTLDSIQYADTASSQASVQPAARSRGRSSG
jgi:hypothetical protein